MKKSHSHELFTFYITRIQGVKSQNINIQSADYQDVWHIFNFFNLYSKLLKTQEYISSL